MFESDYYRFSQKRDASSEVDVSREPRRRAFHPNVRHLELRSPPLRDDHLRQLPFSRPLKQPGAGARESRQYSDNPPRNKISDGSAATHLLLSHSDQTSNGCRDRGTPPQAPKSCQPVHRRAPRLRPDRAYRLLGDDAQAQEGPGHGEPEGKDAALEGGQQQGKGVEPRGPGVRQRLQPDEWEGGEH